MFLSYYKLDINPFKISADPDFLWLGEKHKEALATLRYGIYDNKGFLLLTGDVGAGKTTLINALINSLDDNVLVAVISDPALSKMDFFNFIAHLFGMNKTFKSKGDFIINFSIFLNQVYHDNKKVLLIIDEAQRLSSELLEEIRLLSNIEKQHTKLINIFFAGQHEFNELLHEDKNRALRQRLTLNYHIEPLDLDETDKYIKHRLEVAGTRSRLFDRNAVAQIYKYSGGSPRQINIICDLALLTGFVNEKKIINKEIIQECVRELKIPKKITKKNLDEMPSSEHKAGTKNIDAKPDAPEIELRSNTHDRSKTNIRLPLYFKYCVLLCLTGLIACTIYLYPGEIKQKAGQIAQTIGLYYNSIKERIHKKISHKPLDNQPMFNVPKESAQKEIYQGNLNKPAPTDLPIISKDKISETKKQDTDDSISNIDIFKIFPENPNESLVKQPIISNKDQEITLSALPAQGILDNEKKNAIISEDTIDKENQKPNIKIMSTNLPMDPMDKNQGPQNKAGIDFSYLEKKFFIRFTNNSNDISETNRQEINKICDILTNEPSKKIRITGHTDSKGHPSYNIQLSKFRANIIKSYMMGRGVDSRQIEIQAKGGEEPIASNETPDGRLQNRRVEIKFITYRE